MAPRERCAGTGRPTRDNGAQRRLLRHQQPHQHPGAPAARTAGPTTSPACRWAPASGTVSAHDRQVPGAARRDRTTRAPPRPNCSGPPAANAGPPKPCGGCSRRTAPSRRPACSTPTCANPPSRSASGARPPRHRRKQVPAKRLKRDTRNQFTRSEREVRHVGHDATVATARSRSSVNTASESKYVSAMLRASRQCPA
jgi:hypothetical protein